MTTTASATAADFISDYVDGRWDRINALHQKQLSSAIKGNHPSVIDLLACLSPGRVLADGTPTSPGETACLAPSQQVLISICRGQLLQALAALSMGDTAQANASSTEFCASLSSLLDDASPELTSQRVVLRLAGPAKLCRSLRFFQRGRINQLAGDLPARMTIVLGMHRSGTSALSGMLQAAGLQAPSDVLGASAGNPLGYWESRRLVGLTDRFLNRLGCSWSQFFSRRAAGCTLRRPWNGWRSISMPWPNVSTVINTLFSRILGSVCCCLLYVRPGLEGMWRWITF